MANAVLTAFPAILKNTELEEHELQLQWKLRIQRKFQNSRKRQDSSVTEVMVKKRKQHHLAATEVDSPLMYGVKAYLPPRPDSEDDESLDRHRQWLALEWSRRDPDKDKVCDTCKVDVLFYYLRYQYVDVIFNCILPSVSHYSLTR